METENRHFWVCFCISAMFPIIGGIIAIVLGNWWEKVSHNGVIPNDEDTRHDLDENCRGAIVGTLAGLIIWFLVILNIY